VDRAPIERSRPTVHRRTPQPLRQTRRAIGNDARITIAGDRIQTVRETGFDRLSHIDTVGSRVFAKQEQHSSRRRCGVGECHRHRVSNPVERGLLHASNYNDRPHGHTITLIPGDGIGPEVTSAVVRIVDASGASIEWDTQDAGVLALERRGPPSDALIQSIRRNKVALKGPVTTPIGEGFTSVNVGLRKALDLYANLRPVWNLPGAPARFSASIS